MNQGQVGCSSQQEDDEGDQVQPGEHVRQALVVAGQPAAACHPGEASFHHPSARQQHEAAPSGRGAARPSGGSLRDGLGRADDLQGDAVRLGRLGRALAGLALIDKGQLHVPAGGVLDRLRQRGHGGTVVGAGGRDAQGEQTAQRVPGQVQLGAARACARPTRRGARSRAWSAGCGCPAPPPTALPPARPRGAARRAARRSTARGSCASIAQQPACSPRWACW
jgi:hypothetical protein